MPRPNRGSDASRWSNKKCELRRKISLGGPALFQGKKRSLTNDEISAGMVDGRVLTQLEVEKQTLMLSRLYTGDELQELKDHGTS